MTEASSRSVSLAIPPKPDYIVLARLALSAICRLTPLAADDVADLKLAVSEVANERIADGSDAPVQIQFELQRDRLVVDLLAVAPPSGSEDAALSRAIVEATVDEATYDSSSVRLMKRLPDSSLDLEA